MPSNLSPGDMTAKESRENNLIAKLEALEKRVAEVEATVILLVDEAYRTPTSLATYTVTNESADRTYDANSTTIDEIADVLGTLINDLTTLGFLQ